MHRISHENLMIVDPDSKRRGHWRRISVLALAASLGLAAPLSASANPDIAPVANHDFFAVKTNQTIRVYWQDLLENDLDAEGALVSFFGLAEPLHGVMTHSQVLKAQDSYFEYTPDLDFTGVDATYYRFVDAEDNLSLQGKIFFTVADTVTNRAPDAHADSYAVTGGSSRVVTATNGILNNDNDQDGDGFSLAPGTILPAHGALDLDPSGGFSYTPDKGYAGEDRFQYLIADDSGTLSDYASVTLSVEAAEPHVTSLVMTEIIGGPAGSQGSVRTQIISDNGFNAGAIIDVFVAGKLLALGITDKDGRATIPFTLPNTAGTLPIKVVTGKMSERWHLSTITVTPRPPVVTDIVVAAPPSGQPGGTASLGVAITSANGANAGAVVTAYIDDKKVASKLTDAAGAAKLTVKLPALAGRHSIRLVSGGKSVTTIITLGKAVTAKIGKPKSIKAKKTQTITGSFGYTSGKVTITVTDPKGKVSTKTVSLNSKGKFSYKYTTGKKGSYTMTVSYTANAKYYGAKNYTARFTAR